MKKLVLQLGNVSCPVCAEQVGTMLKKMKGVQEAEVFFSTGKAKLTYNPEEVTVDDLVQAVEKLGYTAKAR